MPAGASWGPPPSPLSCCYASPPPCNLASFLCYPSPATLQLQRALRILGVDMTCDEVALLISEVDANGDGEVGGRRVCGGRQRRGFAGAREPAPALLP